MSDSTLQHARELGKYFRLSWKKRVRRGFFMRAEDFFSFIKKIGALRKEMEDLSNEYDESLSGYGRLLASGVAKKEMYGVESRYGKDPDARSHGESFLSFFEARLVPSGIYLLDEPEVPLSPQRQLSLMYLIHEYVAQDCQFIIATHSPILLSYPGAQIYSFDQAPPAEVPVEELEHISFTRNFLNNPGAYLRHLMK